MDVVFSDLPLESALLRITLSVRVKTGKDKVSLFRLFTRSAEIT